MQVKNRRRSLNSIPLALALTVSLATHSIQADTPVSVLALQCRIDTPGRIEVLDGIRYEYVNQGSNTPLVLVVPGFTQHNRSMEFCMVRDHFLSRGLSVLIMNPPQHGEDFHWTGKIYSWGEQEARDLKTLTDSLGLFTKHPQIHALGFSIGAKTVIRFASLEGVKGRLTSVMAVAPPYRVSDINSRLSGDMGKPMESLISSGAAVDRSGYARMFYMAAFGMTGALAYNRASPADEILAVKDPLLLVHGSNDWLIKANHSLRLYNRSEPGQSVALVILDTRTHAEDLISRDRSAVRQGLFDVLDHWVGLTASGQAALPKDSLQSRLKIMLDSIPWVKDNRVSAQQVSLLDHPTLFQSADRLWYTAPQDQPSLAEVHYSHSLNAKKGAHLRMDAAPWHHDKNFLSGLAAGLDLEDSVGKVPNGIEANLSYAQTWGSVLLFRRIGFLTGIGGESQRRILSMDLCLYLLNFQLNYGTFDTQRRDAELAFSLPLISDAAASYFLGVGYSAFLTGSVKGYQRDTFHSFLVWGPKRQIFGTRIRFNLQYQQEGPLSAGWTPTFSAGASLSLFE